VANVKATYPPDNFATANNKFKAAFDRVVGDSILVCTTFDAATRAQAGGATVFMYNFNIPVTFAGPPLGATHGSELVYVFGTSPTFATAADSQAASDRMQRYWTNFAKTGDPNGGSDPAWAQLTATANVRMNFDLASAAPVTDFRKTECAF